MPQPPIPEPLWNTVPAEAQVAILAVLESLKGRIAELEQRVGDLEGRLKLNSTNSSKPPSSDPSVNKKKRHIRNNYLIAAAATLVGLVVALWYLGVFAVS